MRMLFVAILMTICHHPLGAKDDVIVDARAVFDVQTNLALIQSINRYLSRFVHLPGSEDNRLAAQNFIKATYFPAQVSCQYQSYENAKHLNCEIVTKRIISNINIKNLPASLLEGELKRKLPFQIGQAVDLEKEMNEASATAKVRTETFLRKNGYYGAMISIAPVIKTDSAHVENNIDINNGVFARVNDVIINGDPPMSKLAIRKIFRRMCFRLDQIIESFSRGHLNCYSKEMERETIQVLLDRFAKLGYVQARIRIGHHWVDTTDMRAPSYCRSSAAEDKISRCVNLRIDIERGPKVSWKINLKDNLLINRNSFMRFFGKLFSVDQISRQTVSRDSEETPLDQMIIEEDLLKEITFIKSKNVDEQEISESAAAIRKFLISKGYANASVISSFVQQDADNLVVNFDVYAGHPFYVRSVRILPEMYRDFISEEDLHSLVNIRSFANNGHLSYEEIETARAEIERRLGNRGFYGVKVKADMESLNIGGVLVTFYVDSTPREVIDEITIINGVESLNEEVVPLLNNCDRFLRRHGHGQDQKLCQGSSVVRSKLEEDRLRIVDHYQTSAFLYAQVKSEIQKTDIGYKIIFKIYDSRFGEASLRPLKRQEIKDIIIAGNETTSARVIKRLFSTQRKITMLEPMALKKGIANLREIGGFSRIDHKILFGEQGSNDAYFVLNLAERPSLSIDTAIAFSTDHYFSLETELQESNLFSSLLRLNTSLSLGLFWGRQSVFNNKFIWPFILGKPLRFTLQAPMVVYTDRTHLPTKSRILKSKVAMALEWRLTPKFTPYLRYWLQLSQEEKFLQGLPTMSASERFKTLDGLIPTMKIKGDVRGVFKPGIAYINLDNPFDPHSGVDLNLWTEFSGGPFLGKPPFFVAGTQNHFYIPLGPLTLALQATFMRAFVEPTKENWTQLKNASSAMDKLGGDHSVRGYREDDIGIEQGSAGKFGGYLANIANVELRFPLTSKSSLGNLAGALFVDQGMLIPCSGLFKCLENKSIAQVTNESGWGLSVGAALRYSLPVGPISLDYGFSPLTKKGRFHVIFGFAF